MKNGIETRDYSHFAENLAQQFSDGQNVDAGSLAYLRDFSEASRDSYDRLMDRIADMYEVAPREALSDAQIKSHYDILIEKGYTPEQAVGMIDSVLGDFTE